MLFELALRLPKFYGNKPVQYILILEILPLLLN